MKKRIFTYWVNPPGGAGASDYLHLCVMTWAKNISGLEIIFINHDNINEWLDNKIDFNQFLKLPPMCQSDVASFMLLAKHGGIYMDLDTIVTKDIFDELAKIDAGKFAAFGYKDSMNIHVAVMMSMQPGNGFMSAAADIALERLNALPDNATIHPTHFGNEILNIVMQDEAMKAQVELLCRVESGNILEAYYSRKLKDPFEQYMDFWFSPRGRSINVKDVVKKIKFGAVSLHNSWTPDYYKKYTKNQVMESPEMLSKLLRYVLT